MKILFCKGYELLDSRGNPTVGAEIVLEGDFRGFAISPSGASTGIHEAHELRDKDGNRYNGKGTKKAVKNINEIINKEISDKEFKNQREFDRFIIELDGSENKNNLGANAILAVSLAFAKATAKSRKMPLYKYVGGENGIIMPRPMMNILNGGAHAGNNVDIQEFMITPIKSHNFSESLRICAEIYHTLGNILIKQELFCGVGDEGGFAPDLTSDEQAIELIIKAIEESGYNTDEVKIALDVASSEWYENGIYLKPKSNVVYTPDELISYYKRIIAEYPIVSIEDPLAEDDWENFITLTDEIGNDVQIVGDDLFVTNVKRLEKGIELGVSNAILVKPNQIGTLSETMDVVRLAKNSGYKTVLSHRSGESEDVSISDIAVGLNAGQIKTGAPCRSERTAKYNRLLIIENEIYS